MLAFLLLTLGLLGLYIRLQATTAQRSTLPALVLSWIGVGLTLPYYGAETFGLHAIGQEALKQQNPAYAGFLDDCRQCQLREQCLGRGAQGNRARRVSAVRRLLPAPSAVVPQTGVLQATRWVDVAGRSQPEPFPLRGTSRCASPGYACTREAGSGYQNGFINLSPIGSCVQANFQSRLMILTHQGTSSAFYDVFLEV